MVEERKGLMVFRGQDVTVLGADIHVGDRAPEFSATTKEWSTFRGLEFTQGKVRIIGSLPSLSTGVCDRETKKFNLEASTLGDNVSILMISMDLPWTLDNWCTGAEVNQVITLSDHSQGDFGKKYGVLLKEPRIFRRAVFVVDQGGKVVYVEYLPSLGDEPDYPKVLEAAHSALD